MGALRRGGLWINPHPKSGAVLLWPDPVKWCTFSLAIGAVLPGVDTDIGTGYRPDQGKVAFLAQIDAAITTYIARWTCRATEGLHGTFQLDLASALDA